MPNPSEYTAGSIMDAAAALMNDSAKQVYTYVKQLPYLAMALADLKKELQLNNSPVTNVTTSDPITLVAGVDSVGFSTADPKLPDDLIEIQQVWERATGVYPWTQMTKKEFLPNYMEGVENNQFLIWAWEENEIKLLPCNQSNQLKLDYIRDLFAAVVDENSNIGVINANSYLWFRTGGYLATFVGENPTRGNELFGLSDIALQTELGIDNKGKQAINTRRRPFRAAFKRRGMF